MGRESALLFLPGAFLKADIWFNQILALESAYTIIAPDAIYQALQTSLDAEGVKKATREDYDLPSF